MQCLIPYMRENICVHMATMSAKTQVPEASAALHRAVEGGVAVAEATQVKERLHDRLLRCLGRLLQRELVPVDAARVLVALRRLCACMHAEAAVRTLLSPAVAGKCAAHSNSMQHCGMLHDIFAGEQLRGAAACVQVIGMSSCMHA